jgi:hypothetical protein
MKPGLHRDFQIEEHVRFEIGPGIERTGRITGISSEHIVFIYIITLDEPLIVKGHDRPWTTVTIPGGCLKGECDG